MRTMMLILLLMLSTTTSAQDAIRLDKGQTAPFSGNLIKTKKLEQFYKSHKKLPLVEANLSLERERIELYRVRLRKTESELTKSKIKGNVKTLAGFLLGVVITSVAAKAALESTR